ncbi:MAG: hypothetical protein JST21_05480 [Bacteroidetes bacterium]|nr:hypothetical protein [Bacteroidota bacterium]
MPGILSTTGSVNKNKKAIYHWLYNYAWSVHAVFAFRNTGKNFKNIASYCKRFKVYDLIQHLQRHTIYSTLNGLLSSPNNTKIKEDKLHNVFEASFEWKA